MSLINPRTLSLILGTFGVAKEVRLAIGDAWPELQEAVETFDGPTWEHMSGEDKAKAIAGHAADILDALDNHIPGLNEKLGEPERDAILAWSEKIVGGVVEVVVGARRISAILAEAGVVKLRARRRPRLLARLVGNK